MLRNLFLLLLDKYISMMNKRKKIFVAENNYFFNATTLYLGLEYTRKFNSTTRSIKCKILK